MTQSLLPFLYAELAYSIVFNVLFGVFFVRKVMKLDKLGENHDVTIPRRTWMKFAFILMIICLLILHLTLSFTSDSYWLSQYPNFSFSIFLYVANYTMQSYIVLKMLSKSSGRRYYPNFCFWSYCMIASIIEIAVVQMMDKDKNFTVIIPLLVAIINFFLLFVSLLFDKRVPDTYLIEKLNQKDSSRTIEDSVHQWQRVAPSNRLFIQFNQNFEIDQQNSGLTCIFKIAVYVDENASIISKTDGDFYKLGVQMEKFFPHRPEAILPQQTRKFSNMMKLGEEKLKVYETYLLDLTRTGEFIIPCLLDFLEVPASLRSKLMTHERRQTYVRNDSGLTEVEDKIRQPFFKVTCQKGKYILQNTDFLEFIINKSSYEILQFYTKLKDEKRITIEMLPQHPSQEEIVSFFNFVVNRKPLWRSFASWFRLDIKLQNKVYNYLDPWMLGFKKLQVDIVGHEIVFDGDGKIHTCYLVSIKNKLERRTSFSHQSEDRGVILKKRYSEFCTLDKHVRRFMSKNKMNMDSLPAIPPKFSPFGSKTSPKSRQVRFGIYIKGLIQIQGINHCIKLLEFLDFDSMTEMEPPVEIQPEDRPENSQLSYFSDLNQQQ